MTDAALSTLDEQSLLRALLERVKKVLQADTAAVLLLDRHARQLAADRAALALQSMTLQDALAAVALHRSLLPTALPVMPGLDLAAGYVTGSGTVGGDWYDVFVLPDGRLGVVVGDVAGSGLEAAVIMGRMRSALRAYVLAAADPGTALRMLDRKIQYFEPDAMATVLYGPRKDGTASRSACLR